MARKSHEDKKRELKKAVAWLDEHEIKNPGMRKFLIAYSKTGTITAACRELGFGAQKIQNWRKGFNTSHGRPSTPTEEGERFAAAMEEAKQRYIENLEYVLDQRAVRGSDNLLMFRLKGLKPETYRESWRTAGSPNSPTSQPGTPTTVNQLITIGLQDPAKLQPVLELAKKMGLLDRLFGAQELSETAKLALTKGDLAPATFREIVKNERDPATGDFLPERGEDDLETPDVSDKEL